jgi:hypothetical protein
MTTTLPHRSPAAERRHSISPTATRSRRKRARRRRGLRCLTLAVDQDTLVEYLVRTGRLSAEEALSKPAIEAVTATVLCELIGRWAK